jgi:glycogen(starch) synthase
MYPTCQASRPLQILMTGDAVGGVLHYALDLAAGLAAHGVQTTLALLGPAPSEAQRQAAATVPGLRLVETGLALDWLAEDPAAATAAARGVSELACRYDVDLVHLNTPTLAGGSYDRPTVSVVHSCLASWWAAVRTGPPPEDFRWRTEALARGIAASKVLVAPSVALAAEIWRIYGRRPLVVHNGRAVAKVRRSNAQSQLAITAGRLWDEGKDIATLDRAAGLTELPILAVGPTTGPNGSGIALHGLQSIGELAATEVRALLASKPIFVTSALYEPFGLAVLEAAQAGCALVLSDIATFRELWDDAAIFVPVRDAEGFGRALSQLAAAPERRAILGAAARERAQRYTIAALAGQMLQIYAGAISCSPRACDGAAA